MQLPKLIKKKECYRISWFGLLLLLLMVFLISSFLRNQIHDYLSPVEPVNTKVLVLEGWLDDFAIEEAYALFLENNYDYLITTGGPLEIGYIATQYITSAELSKTTLIKLGMDSSLIISVPRAHVLENRTYQSALALKQWIDINDTCLKSFNLVSLGVHSKRSLYLFKKAMPDKEIGIIALRDQRYDPKKWWKSSKGLRTVITETLGYFYVLFFM